MENLTRGQYGVTPRPERVAWDAEINDWRADPDGDTWGCWDPDFGWQAPWTVED